MTAPLAIDTGNGYEDLPMPTENGYKTVPQELSYSNRNQAGTLYKYRIAVKQTIEVTWGTQPPEDKTRILRMTAGNSFNVRYFDTADSTFKYGRFYRGSDLDIVPLIRYDGTDFVCYNVKMTLVEF